MAHDPERGAMTAIEWGVKKYYMVKTDAELAIGLNTDIQTIQETLKDLGLTRPTGTETMKEFARQYLLSMTPQEKKEFMRDIEPLKIWEMAEGKAAAMGELTVHTEPMKIDITHQLKKVYEIDAPAAATVLDPDVRSGGRTSTPALP